MLNRRSALKTTIGLIAAPALPAVGKLSSTLESNPVHARTDFRTALNAYVDAYQAFFAIAPSSGPQDEGVATDLSDATGEALVFWQGMLDRCRAWRRSRKRLVAMVLEANGYLIEGPAPPTVAAAMVDLGDVLVVVSGESLCEGTRGTSSMNCINFCVVPRSPAMKAKLEALPVWPDDECCDDSCYSPRWYRGWIESHSSLHRDDVDDDMED